MVKADSKSIVSSLLHSLLSFVAYLDYDIGVFVGLFRQFDALFSALMQGDFGVLWR